MALLDQFKTEPLPKKWQDDGREWQETCFPEMPVVLDEATWSRYYPGTPLPFLTCIPAKPDGFADFARKVVGAMSATDDLSFRLWRADDIPDSQFMTALKIICAQASTELASIQHHRMVHGQLDFGSLNGLDREVVEGIEVPLPEGLALERELQNPLFVMGDAKEDFKAFLEKRKPRFQGM